MLAEPFSDLALCGFFLFPVSMCRKQADPKQRDCTADAAEHIREDICLHFVQRKVGCRHGKLEIAAEIAALDFLAVVTLNHIQFPMFFGLRQVAYRIGIRRNSLDLNRIACKNRSAVQCCRNIGGFAEADRRFVVK